MAKMKAESNGIENLFAAMAALKLAEQQIAAVRNTQETTTTNANKTAILQLFTKPGTIESVILQTEKLKGMSQGIETCIAQLTEVKATRRSAKKLLE